MRKRREWTAGLTALILWIGAMDSEHETSSGYTTGGEPATGGEQEKTIKFVANNLDAEIMRRAIYGVAGASDLRVVALQEQRSWMSTTFTTTVAGEPSRIREFHDQLRGDAWSTVSGGFIFDSLVVSLIVDGVRAGRRKWQGRNDPPLEETHDAPPAPDDLGAPPVA